LFSLSDCPVFYRSNADKQIELTVEKNFYIFKDLLCINFNIGGCSLYIGAKA